MSYILLDLKSRFSLSWLHEHIIIYADDVHLRWIINSHPQALNALIEFQHMLDVLKTYGFQINMTKSVAIMRLIGREAPAFQRRWVHRQRDGPFLRLPENHWRLPLMSKTAYLGVIISYRA